MSSAFVFSALSWKGTRFTWRCVLFSSVLCVSAVVVVRGTQIASWKGVNFDNKPLLALWFVADDNALGANALSRRLFAVAPDSLGIGLVLVDGPCCRLCTSLVARGCPCAMKCSTSSCLAPIRHRYLTLQRLNSGFTVPNQAGSQTGPTCL